jgi:RNA recognition motif-containing protein
MNLASFHQERVQNAGRVGTKRYRNPSLVFMGNLSLQITNATILQNWIVQQMGLPSSILLSDCKIITEWKTGRSKGYGFVVFTEPIYASVAITKLHGQIWYDRSITVHPGVRKQVVAELHAIHTRAAIKQQERQLELYDNNNNDSNSDSSNSSNEIVYMDAQEAAMIKRLDPDLLEGVTIVVENSSITTTPTSSKTGKLQQQSPNSGITTSTTTATIIDDYDVDEMVDDDDDDVYDYDDDPISLLSGQYDDDDDDDVDGIWDPNDDHDDEPPLEYNMNNNHGTTTVVDSTTTTATTVPLNREQRRDAAKSKKKMKPPSRGFGGSTTTS